MSILWERLPESLFIGKEVKINSDFRTMLKFEEIMINDELSDNQKVFIALKLFYPDEDVSNLDLEKAYEGLMWFYTCGKEKEDSEEDEKPSGDKASKKMIFSFKYDANYIFAAFLQQYNIDLTITKMHWWKFRALFDGLTDKTQLIKIIGYRSMTIDSKLPAAERQRLRELKSTYALPDMRTQEEKESEFANALW